MAKKVKNICQKISGVWKYYYGKIVRDKGTPEYIARGWAIGVFIGFAIPFGFQLICSIPLSFLLKGSKLGAMIGTLVTNHFTIFLIYPFQTWMGNKLIRGNLSWMEVKSCLENLFVHQDFKTLFSLGLEICSSFLLGGLVLAVVFTPAAYYWSKNLVIRYRRHKEKKRQAKEGEQHGNRTTDH